MSVTRATSEGRRTWCINDVDSMLLLLASCGHGRDPVTERRCTLDGDTLLPLKLHTVHLRSNTVPASDLVDLPNTTSVVQYPFRQSSLARIDVRGDPDIALVLQTAQVFLGERVRRRYRCCIFNKLGRSGCVASQYQSASKSSRKAWSRPDTRLEYMGSHDGSKPHT